MKVINPGSVIGIIGGGQLGRMIAQAAAELGYKTHIFTPESESPAAQVATRVTCAAYDDREALEFFASSVDVISFEFENVPSKSLALLEKLNQVRPRAHVLHISQNRLREKGFFNEHGIPTNRFSRITSFADLEEKYRAMGKGIAVLKTVELGYDGKGQTVIKSTLDLQKAWESFGSRERILEEFVPFEKEISVIVARGMDTKSVVYPPAENVHKKGILDTSTVPANISKDTEKEARKYAMKIADKLHIVGLLAVEFFVLKNGHVLANEIAPRPHNSGHWTMDGCATSQFEQFVRAICGLPLGSVEMHSKVVMKNLIGEDIEKQAEIAKDPNAKLHIYGKREIRPGRKMGHVNYISKL